MAHPARRIAGIALIALVLGAPVLGLIWRAGAPARALVAARSRWEANPVVHYRMRVKMQGWGACIQDATVQRERVSTIGINSCRFFSPRTVSGLFAETERFLRPPEFGSACRRGLPGRDCSCYTPYHVEAVYNTQRGYIEELHVSWGAYRPNPAHLDYWRHLLRHGREPACGGPLEPPGRHVIVEHFEALP